MLASGLSTLVCDSISGFEGLRVAIVVFVPPLIGLEQSRIREVDRLV